MVAINSNDLRDAHNIECRFPMYSKIKLYKNDITQLHSHSTYLAYISPLFDPKRFTTSTSS